MLKKIIIIITFTLMILSIPLTTIYANSYSYSWDYNSANDWYTGNSTAPKQFYVTSRIQNASFNGAKVSHINWVMNEHWLPHTYRNVILFNPGITGSPTVKHLGSSYQPIKEWNIYYKNSSQSSLSVDYKLSNNQWGASEAVFPYLGNKSYYSWSHNYEGMYNANVVTGMYNPYRGDIVDHGPDVAYGGGIILPR